MKLPSRFQALALVKIVKTNKFLSLPNLEDCLSPDPLLTFLIFCVIFFDLRVLEIDIDRNFV